MADIFYTAGKKLALEGIIPSVTRIKLKASGSVVAEATVTGSSVLDVSAAAVLSNTSAINFTIETGDVGEVVDTVLLGTSTESFYELDLDDTVTLTTEGTATFAVGDLTTTL